MSRSVAFPLVLLAAAATATAAADCSVTCQGLLTGPSSAAAGHEIHVTRLEGSGDPAEWIVSVESATTEVSELTLRGEAFLASGPGLVVAVQRPETDALPGTLRAYDLEGNEVWSRPVAGLSNPTISPDGRYLGFLSSEGTVVVDLTDFREERHVRLAPFALGPKGAVAGATTEADRAGGPREPDAYALVVAASDLRAVLPIDSRPERVAFAPDDRSVLVLSRAALIRLDPGDGSSRTLFRAPEGMTLRDMRVTEDGICLGMRRVKGATFTGQLAMLDPDGALRELRPGPSRTVERPGRTSRTSARDGGIPWPLAPDEQHAVGNTYGEYQNYGGTPYLHPGVDVMGVPGQPVYAVADGVVKAVLTTSGDWHWRVATADSATSDLCTGYLYAHLDLPTIAVGVGDSIVQGQYLGDLVEWTTSEFHHVHFARIEDAGLEWYGDWMTTDNPHTDFVNQTETEPPVFEPARGSDLLAFCLNESSEYQGPDALSGQVDIIAHVGDTIESSWVCSVQEIRYTIYPLGLPQDPVVVDKLAVRFDMALDTYSGGSIDRFLVGLFYKQDGTCRTRGDYSFREFYHVITNSDGDEVYDSSDVWQAWDTTELPDADYVVRVTATDAAGNAASDSMVVTTANGNPTWTPYDGPQRVALESPFPSPSRQGASIEFSLPAPGRAVVAVYSASGQLVREVIDGDFPQGSHVARWDGRDAAGDVVASGVYMVRLEAGGTTRARKLVVAR